MTEQEQSKTGQQPGKTKGVADIVFLLDATGSMGPCIEALKQNIGMFIDSLTQGNNNEVAPVKDWRAKVVGFRDFEEQDPAPLVDNPFVRDASELKAQLTRLECVAGGDTPESMLDALYVVATMGQTDKGAQAEDPNRWRYRSDAARVVVAFTDAPFKEKMSVAAASGGTVDDVSNILTQNRIILSLFAPNFPCYESLSETDKSEWEVIDIPGKTAQESLAAFTSDQENFRKTLRQLAATVSKSTETAAL